MTSKQKYQAIMAAKAYHREVILFVSSPWRILEIRQRNREIEDAVYSRNWEEYYDQNEDWLSEFAE